MRHLVPGACGDVDYLKFILVSLTWGSSFILMKKAQASFGPMAISGWRCLLGAAGLALFLGFRKRRNLFRGQRVLAIVILVASSYVWPYVLQPVIIDELSSGFTSITIAFIPIFTVIVSVPMLKKWPTRQELIGVLCGLACMVTLFLDKMQGLSAPAYLVLALTVPFSYAIGNTWNKRAFSDADPVVLALVCMVIGGVVMTPVSAATETVNVDHPQFRTAAWAMVALGVVGTGFALGMFYGLIRDRGPLFAGMVTYLIPLGGVLLGSLDGEVITLRQGLATIGVLVSVGITQVKSRREPGMPPIEAAGEA